MNTVVLSYKMCTNWYCFTIATALACFLCFSPVMSEPPPMTVQKIVVEKKKNNDLQSQATGYIFRSDGDSPPILIKLGNGNIHQYDDVLKKAGFTSNFESSGTEFGDINVPSKSTRSSVRSEYDGDAPSHSSFSSEKSAYTDISTPSRSRYSSVKTEYTDIDMPASKSPIAKSHRLSEAYTGHPYSGSSKGGSSRPSTFSDDETEEEIFKEAFKLIQSVGASNRASSGGDDEFTSLPKSSPHTRVGSFEDNRSYEGADEDDGYSGGGFNTPSNPGPGPRQESDDDEDDESPSFDDRPKPGGASGRAPPTSPKGYVAPFFDVPQSHEIVFNDRSVPEKYNLNRNQKAPIAPLLFEKFSSLEGSPVNGGEYQSGEKEDFSSKFGNTNYQNHQPIKNSGLKKSTVGGESFKADHHSTNGEKTGKGFKKYNDFEEGEMGHHGKEGKKGYFDHEKGHKKSHHHEGKKYGEVEGKLHGEKGVKYDESEGHEKGHKTTGYHNIFHKDEFKKEHKFYDDVHKHGHKNKKGGFHTDHGKKHGHKSSGGFDDTAFDHGHKGDSGTYKKGHFDQDHKGHKGASGHESHFKHHEDFGKKDGHSEHKKYGDYDS